MFTTQYVAYLGNDLYLEVDAVLVCYFTIADGPGKQNMAYQIFLSVIHCGTQPNMTCEQLTRYICKASYDVSTRPHTLRGTRFGNVPP